jgi:hypothetical protein
MSYVLKFNAEILLILAYGLGLTDQTMNDSPFHMMWVIDLEVQITTGMNCFSVHFCGQFRALLHDQDIQEWNCIISFNFHCEFDGRSETVQMVKNGCNLAGPCGQTTKMSSMYLSHLVGLLSAVSNAISSKCSINILLTIRDSGFPTATHSFC